MENEMEAIWITTYTVISTNRGPPNTTVSFVGTSMETSFGVRNTGKPPYKGSTWSVRRT